MVIGQHPSYTLAALEYALKFWVENGFLQVDLPWTVESQYVDATRPPDTACAALPTHYGKFVCSGEQAFLCLWDKGYLPYDQSYIGWTPCIRNEVQDVLHQYSFMKAELFVPMKFAATETTMHEIIRLQRLLFQELGSRFCGVDLRWHLNIEQVTDTQWDILVGNTEVGSYGWREFNGHAYVYGTALAEPRFTTAVNLLTK